MPDDVSRSSGQTWETQNHASQHTSSHAPRPARSSAPADTRPQHSAASQEMPRSRPAPVRRRRLP
ncbi:hypothetical protein NKH18_32705 [Streptomyces sp. M10(2022)]